MEETKRKRDGRTITERGSREIIGWREWIGLPDLGVQRIKVKVDTGARSSALHATRLELFASGGRRMVRFEVHPLQRDATTTVAAEARLLALRPVTNSGGRSELRPVIRTRLCFREEEWLIELTLTSRDVMGFRMLLAREAIRGKFIVDPARSFIWGRPGRTKKTGRVDRPSEKR